VSLPAGARDVRRVGGGDINEAWHLTLADGTDAFLKSRPGAAAGEYETEAAGLRWLTQPGALRVPRVLEVAHDRLLLEWIEPGHLNEAGAEELGRGLAAVHAAGAPHFGDPRAEAGASTRFGSLALPNDATPDWPSFFVHARLRPLARLALLQGRLTQAGRAAIERICERVNELAGPPEPPARLHGDLWSGNVHADARGRPWLIDPAVYGGHREMDLAMLRLFGAPPQRIFAAYEEVAPLAEGWRERVQLWQLAPLLVHAILFGGSYCAAAERIAVHYAA
jgi:fructosamine-3-kinase